MWHIARILCQVICSTTPFSDAECVGIQRLSNRYDFIYNFLFPSLPGTKKSVYNHYFMKHIVFFINLTPFKSIGMIWSPRAAPFGKLRTSRLLPFVFHRHLFRTEHRGIKWSKEGPIHSKIRPLDLRVYPRRLLFAIPSDLSSNGLCRRPSAPRSSRLSASTRIG